MLSFGAPSVARSYNGAVFIPLIDERANVIDVTATSEAYVTLEALLKDAERDAIVVSPAVARVLERRFTLAPISQPVGGPGYRLEGLEQPA